MSYPRDLDEYSDTELMGELMGRAGRRAIGRCDYCDRLRDEGETSCKFPERHRLAVTMADALDSGELKKKGS